MTGRGYNSRARPGRSRSDDETGAERKSRSSFKSTDPRSDISKNGKLPPISRSVDSASNLLSSLTGRADNRTPDGFVKRSSSEECFKCMLKIPHQKCQGHKYIRIGGGYRHSYGMVKAMLEAIELERQRQAIIQQRLDAINENNMHAIKTYIRTKSGRLVERIVFMNDADYKAFQEGGDAARDILNKYLSKDEAKGLESWDKEEQKAITVYVRTKSGRRIAKTVYVTKDEYEKMKKGEINADDLMKKYVTLEEGQKLDGWGEAEMKAVKMFVRTKSGRLIEKTIMMSKEDFEELERIKAAGGDTSKLLNKYMSVNDGDKIEGWKETSGQAMKAVKVMVRTKSGRLVEKTVLMTEEEFKEFEKSGGDLNFLKKFLPLGKDENIEGWEKASTVYSGDAELVKNAKAGQRVIGKNGQEYEVVVDPLTGKKYLKKVVKKGDATLKKGKIGKGFIPGAAHDDPNERGMTKEQKLAYRAGARREGSASDYSYTSHVSAGGTRHVMRRRKRADGTYSAAHSYHSSQDEEGKARRKARRNQRKQVAIKKEKENFTKGKRREGSDSDYSYRSVISAGGTRHVKRRRRRADGTYSAEHSYHSSQDEEGEKRRKARRKERQKAMAKGKRNPGSASDYSYTSHVSAGGTRHVTRRRKRADGTYSAAHSYHSSQDAEGQERRRKRRQERQKAYKGGKRREGSDSDYSYRSIISAGGTRHVRRRRKRGDGTYSRSESYHSSRDGDGEARRRRRRRDRKHEGSEHSYYSVVSAGGTRHVRRKKRLADGTYAKSESYHSSDSGMFDKKKKKKRGGPDSEYSYFSEVSAGGTRRKKKVKRIRDKDGKVIGHGAVESASSSDSSDSSYESRSDGKGGRIKVKKDKKGKKGKKKGGGPNGNMTDFSGSLLSTDPDDLPDFTKMTEAEKKAYFEAKAIRQAEREKKRRAKYGDKYDEMMAKHQMAKDATKKAKKGKKGGGPTGSMTDFSNDLLSTASEDEPDLSKMTEAEKKAYFEAKAKRQAERERKRREKYGDKYDEMMEKHQLAKEAQKAAKSMVHYGKGSDRFKDGEMDERGMMGQPGFGKGKGGKDGEDGLDEKARKAKLKAQGLLSDSEESVYEYARDEHGNILRDKDGKPIMKKVGTKKKLKEGDAGNGYEYKRDKHGNLVRVKKGEEVDSDDDYFEVMPDGTLRLKAGKKKIDISKLTDEDLRRLGIDPRNMTKEQIAKLLKEKFGDQIEITRDGAKVGLKNIADYGSDVNTDDLANDSDLDTSTLRGQKRVRVLMKRGGAAMQEQMKKLIDDSLLADAVVHPEERDASVDFLTHYRLVDTSKLESYARAFVVEDDDKDGIIYPREAKLALDGVPSIQGISRKQLDYILKVLDIDKENMFTFRMFAVMTALAERVTQMDQYCKNLLEIANTMDIYRKMKLYKAMFFCNVEGDHDSNYITSESLMIELMAGGLNWDQQQFIMERMKPNEWREVNFLDYLAYIPLFMSMHDNMCFDPLDMSNDKYEERPPSVQKDMNPLGYAMNKLNMFDTKQKVQPGEILGGKNDVEYAAKVDNVSSLYSKYKKLPEIKNNIAKKEVDDDSNSIEKSSN